MVRPTNLVSNERLDNRRKPSFSPEARNVDKNTMTEELTKLVKSSKPPEVKEVYLKIKCSSNYDNNVKAIANIDVKQLKDTLIYLREVENDKEIEPQLDELLKQGLIYEVINTIARLLPHKCGGCHS